MRAQSSEEDTARAGGAMYFLEGGGGGGWSDGASLLGRAGGLASLGYFSWKFMLRRTLFPAFQTYSVVFRSLEMSFLDLFSLLVWELGRWTLPTPTPYPPRCRDLFARLKRSKITLHVLKRAYKQGAALAAVNIKLPNKTTKRQWDAVEELVWLGTR